MGSVIDLTGKRFGRLVVIKRMKNSKDGKAMWLCRCDCGNKTIVPTCNLNSGHSKSCGCITAESASKRNKKHGDRHTRLYGIWTNMKTRCANGNCNRSRYYHEKGIFVCEEWESYENFKKWSLENGYNDSLTLDRIDNSKGYEPSNCRWATYKQQERNKTNNHVISYNGMSKTMVEWSEILGINYGTLRSRIYRGWSIQRAFEQIV